MLLSNSITEPLYFGEKLMLQELLATYTMAGLWGHLEMVVSQNGTIQVGQGFIVKQLKFSCICKYNAYCQQFKSNTKNKKQIESG
jgi:hypothetical protein